jgi:hypothetical protein
MKPGAGAECMSEVRKEEFAYWAKRRDDYFAGLSERIRTMSLGTLVVIWGLFSSDKSALTGTLTKPFKVALLAIALSSVIVLTIDLLEHIFGYQEGRQRTEKCKMKPDLDYKRLKRRASLAKQILGCATLVAFIAALGAILFTAVVHAAPVEDMNNYYGRWCGGNPNTNESDVLIIDHDEGVEFNDVKCTSPEPRERYIIFTCENYNFAASRHDSQMKVSRWQGDWSGSEHRHWTLYDCQRSISMGMCLPVVGGE